MTISRGPEGKTALQYVDDVILAQTRTFEPEHAISANRPMRFGLSF